MLGCDAASGDVADGADRVACGGRDELADGAEDLLVASGCEVLYYILNDGVYFFGVVV